MYPPSNLHHLRMSIQMIYDADLSFKRRCLVMHGHFLHMINCRNRESRDRKKKAFLNSEHFWSMFSCFSLLHNVSVNFLHVWYTAYHSNNNNVKHFNRDTLLYRPVVRSVNSAIYVEVSKFWFSMGGCLCSLIFSQMSANPH